MFGEQVFVDPDPIRRMYFCFLITRQSNSEFIFAPRTIRRPKASLRYCEIGSARRGVPLSCYHEKRPMPALSTPPNAADLQRNSRKPSRKSASSNALWIPTSWKTAGTRSKSRASLSRFNHLAAARIAHCRNHQSSRKRQRWTKRNQKACAITRKDATLFRRKFLSSLAREKNWNAGDALDFRTICRFTRAFFPQTPAVAVSRSNRPIIPCGPLRLRARFVFHGKSPRRRHPRSHGNRRPRAHVTDRTAAQPESEAPLSALCNSRSQRIGSTCTAVPYASTSVTPFITSVAS